jgi:hypothetical protein
MKKVKFEVTFELNVALDLDQIWPEGDAPEDPQVDDVFQAMFEGRDRKPYNYEVFRMLEEWNLDDDGVFEVRKIEGEDQG